MGNYIIFALHAERWYCHFIVCHLWEFWKVRIVVELPLCGLWCKMWAGQYLAILAMVMCLTMVYFTSPFNSYNVQTHHTKYYLYYSHTFSLIIYTFSVMYTAWCLTLYHNPIYCWVISIYNNYFNLIPIPLDRSHMLLWYTWAWSCSVYWLCRAST